MAMADADADGGKLGHSGGRPSPRAPNIVQCLLLSKPGQNTHSARRKNLISIQQLFLKY